jgi:conjugal transfer pilus assembly protein TraI
VPVYPPVDQGIQVVDVDSLLAGQSDMLKRLRVLAGGTDVYYARYFESIVRNLADYVQLLPASNTDTHQGAGGLFRLCLEMGFYSLQSAERIVFAEQESVELRRELEPRWRYAVFMAGLCGELYRPISDMLVTDSEGKMWPKYLKSLTAWATETHIDRYFVQWRKAPPLHTQSSGRADVAVVMRAILPDYTLQYLEEGSASIIPVVFAVASNSTHPSDHQVARIVFETRVKILKRDSALRKDNYGRLQLGNHLDPYLLDAMRTLFRNGTWKVNAEKSRLWLTRDGLFLIWKSGAKEILSTLTQTGLTGAPNDIATLAEMMAEARIITRNGNSPIWVITPPGATDEYQAVKIAEPISVLEDDEIEPVDAVLKKATPTTSTKSAPSIIPPVANAAPEPPPLIKAKPKSTPQEDPIDTDRDLSAHAADHTPAPQPADDSGEPIAQPTSLPASSAQSRPRPEPKPDPGAEILPAVELSSFAANVREEARAILKPDLQEVIGKMIDDYRKGRNKQSIVDVPEGIAFENQLVLKYGLSYDRVVGFLHAQDWLQAPAGNPNAKNMKVQSGGKQMTCIVLKHKAVRLLGFREGDE